jgi:hypothetical protein
MTISDTDAIEQCPINSSKKLIVPLFIGTRIDPALQSLVTIGEAIGVSEPRPSHL